MFGRDRKKSFDSQKLLQRVQNAQQGFSESLKNITVKAKKEVKIVNKKARKVLATEDGGKYREEYILTANLDAGHDLFKYYENIWKELHEAAMINVSKSQETDKKVLEFTKEFQRSNTHIEEFYGNLSLLPEVITQIEIAQKNLDSIALQARKVEELLVAYDDLIERCAFQKKKDELKFRLSQLVETKYAEYNIKKAMVANRQLSSESRDAVDSPIMDESVRKLEESTELPLVKKPEIKSESKQQESADRQQAYEDAFLDQMNRYIQFGEVDRPISGSVVSGEVSIEDDIQIDEDDLSTLKEFLGPDELNSVLEASQFKDSSITKDLSSEIVENETCENINEADNMNLVKENIEEITDDSSLDSNTIQKNSSEHVEEKCDNNSESVVRNLSNNSADAVNDITIDNSIEVTEDTVQNSDDINDSSCKETSDVSEKSSGNA